MPTSRASAGSGIVDLALDMYETDSDVVVTMAVPGIAPEDLEISVTGHRLTVKGETKAEAGSEGKDWVIRERRYGKFMRSITLPERAEADKAEAEFENGVLTLTVPKREEAKAKSIQVQNKTQD
jgi:HSP20 family protein